MEEEESAELAPATNLSTHFRCAHAARVDPKLLKAHPLNPNEHPDSQIDLFIEILKYQGWRRPITVSKRSNYITKGHGAHLAAIKLGLSAVPVDYQDYDDDPQELADIVADNQLSRMAMLNTGKLETLVTQISTTASLHPPSIELLALDSKILSLVTSKIGSPHTSGDDSLRVETPPVPAPALASETGSYSAEPEFYREAGEANAPHEANLPPVPKVVETSPVRIIQLQFTQESVAEFVTLVEYFQKELNIDNTTDTLIAVLRACKDSNENETR